VIADDPDTMPHRNLNRSIVIESINSWQVEQFNQGRMFPERSRHDHLDSEQITDIMDNCGKATDPTADLAIIRTFGAVRLRPNQIMIWPRPQVTAKVEHRVKTSPKDGALLALLLERVIHPQVPQH
jgi:hypothetical protein